MKKYSLILNSYLFKTKSKFKKNRERLKIFSIVVKEVLRLFYENINESCYGIALKSYTGTLPISYHCSEHG